MGCYAAVSALRLAHHIVRSEPEARVLVVTVELSSLHLQYEEDVERLLAALQFGDGATASLVTAEPSGFALSRPFAATLPNSAELIRWRIGDHGFVMDLSGEVPGRIGEALRDTGVREAMLGNEAPDAFDAWAVHAGGRSVLDAVEHGLGLPPRGAGRVARGARPLRQHVLVDPALRARSGLLADPERAARDRAWPSGPASRRRASISSGRREIAEDAGPRRRADGRPVARPASL